MPNDHVARKRLLDLNASDIRLTAEIPSLGESWARRANVSRKELIR